MLVRAFIMARGSIGGVVLYGRGEVAPGWGEGGREYMHARGRYGLAIWWTCLTGQLTGTRGM
jgi:hypothetical protein